MQTIISALVLLKYRTQRRLTSHKEQAVLFNKSHLDQCFL